MNKMTKDNETLMGRYWKDNSIRNLMDKFYESNEETIKLYRKLLENLNPRIETKIAVKKIINSKYAPQSEKTYKKINSKLNIPKYN